jgi:hypothetical protein
LCINRNSSAETESYIISVPWSTQSTVMAVLEWI